MWVIHDERVHPSECCCLSDFKSAIHFVMFASVGAVSNSLEVIIVPVSHLRIIPKAFRESKLPVSSKRITTLQFSVPAKLVLVTTLRLEPSPSLNTVSPSSGPVWFVQTVRMGNSCRPTICLRNENVIETSLNGTPSTFSFWKTKHPDRRSYSSEAASQRASSNLEALEKSKMKLIKTSEISNMHLSFIQLHKDKLTLLKIMVLCVNTHGYGVANKSQ